MAVLSLGTNATPGGNGTSIPEKTAEEI